MAPDFRNFMMEATRLTQSGDVTRATAMIQRALNHRVFAADAAPGVRASGLGADAAPGAAGDDVVDVEAREVFTAGHDASACTPLLPVRERSNETVGECRQAEVPPPAARQGRFVSGRFGNGRAARDFKLFIPAIRAGGGASPLVVMLHGCTQNPDDFAAGTRMNELAEAQGFCVLYPAQSREANPQGCWNWFKANHQQRGRGEPATLAGMTQHVVAEYGLDASRVYVAGLSAGGAMAAILGQAYPDLFAAVGVHSGVAPGAAKDLPGALAAMQGRGGGSGPALRVPTIVFHGDADPTVHARNGEQLYAASPGEPHTEHSETVRPRGSRRAATRRRRSTPDGRVVAEHWVVHGAAHAWVGGHRSGSHTDPDGPDASAEMLRFFMDHRLEKAR